MPPKTLYSFEGFLLDAAEGVLLREGQPSAPPVPLTPKMFGTLLALVRRAGHVVKKEELLDEVWPDSSVEEGNLNVTVFMLRNALGREDGGQKFIKTVPRRGYSFVAPVREVEDGDGGRADAPRPAARDKKVVSLAVLPLLNESPDRLPEYLSDGLTESIINNLSQMPAVRVLARGTAFRYKGLDPLVVARACDVRAVLTGRIRQKDDNTLVISAELVETDLKRDSGWQLWGGHYESPTADTLKLQAEISRKVSEVLRTKLSDEEAARPAGPGGAKEAGAARPHTKSTEAYQAYLKGRYHWNKRTKGEIERGLKYFKEAIGLDPDYALAYAGIADSYALLGAVEYAALPPAEAMRLAHEATVQALKIDDALAEAHASLAYVMIFKWSWAEAEREYRRSIELNPSYATARHWYAHYLTATGRQTEAVVEMRRARELDPLSLPINAGMGWHYYLTRQYDEAIREYRKTLDFDENFYMAHFLLGMAYEQVSLYEDALASYERALELSGGSPAMAAAPGHAYAMQGRHGEARRVLAVLREIDRRRFVSPYHIAVIHAALGETDEAFEWLGRARDAQSEALIWLAVDPMLDSLRTDPRFADLTRSIGLDF